MVGAGASWQCFTVSSNEYLRLSGKMRADGKEARVRVIVGTRTDPIDCWAKDMLGLKCQATANPRSGVFP